MRRGFLILEVFVAWCRFSGWEPMPMCLTGWRCILEETALSARFQRVAGVRNSRPHVNLVLQYRCLETLVLLVLDLLR